MFFGEGFFDEICGSIFDGIHGIRNVPCAGDHQYRQLRITFMQLFQHGKTVLQSGKTHVLHHDIEAVFIQNLLGFIDVGGRVDNVTFIAQQVPGQFAKDAVVISDKNADPIHPELL